MRGAHQNNSTIIALSLSMAFICCCDNLVIPTEHTAFSSIYIRLNFRTKIKPTCCHKIHLSMGTSRSHLFARSSTGSRPPSGSRTCNGSDGIPWQKANKNAGEIRLLAVYQVTHVPSLWSCTLVHPKSQWKYILLLLLRGRPRKKLGVCTWPRNQNPSLFSNVTCTHTHTFFFSETWWYDMIAVPTDCGPWVLLPQISKQTRAEGRASVHDETEHTEVIGVSGRRREFY